MTPNHPLPLLPVGEQQEPLDLSSKTANPIPPSLLDENDVSKRTKKIVTEDTYTDVVPVEVSALVEEAISTAKDPTTHLLEPNENQEEKLHENDLETLDALSDLLEESLYPMCGQVFVECMQEKFEKQATAVR